ncbi:MAG: PHP domain-containing protein [Candidatus Saganbacteria bacterium]|uniref:PHP domain-containing protein n=1 Tax=Candidatus Saganbacteria bacterium TaxID=2575572 RepID=A0A833NXC4_UNCSA|nr:MAG: PHP domain-containing protein [Candidatus Saganbacteria bacterium]
MPADLHIHSNFSDGIDTPEEIVGLAKKAGLNTIALTDHDVVDGIERAQKAGEIAGIIEVIPGIEFTCEMPNAEVHILGYFIDYKNSKLKTVLKTIQDDRVKRIGRICEKLNGLGINLKPEEVLAISGSGVPGRPHVARALIKKGIVSNFKEAFIRFLDNKAPAFVGHYRLTPVEAIKLIIEIGGIAVFAHPAVSNCDDLIPDFIKDGLRGIEVYYGGHNYLQTKKYLALAKKYGLLVTGGSDFHGTNSGREVKLGDTYLKDEYLKELKDEHLRRNKS